MSLSVNEEIYNRNLAGQDFGPVPPNNKIDSFNIGGTQSTVIASATINSSHPCFVFKNNKMLRYTTDYTISGLVVTFGTNLVASDFVVLMYTV